CRGLGISDFGATAGTLVSWPASESSPCPSSVLGMVALSRSGWWSRLGPGASPRFAVWPDPRLLDRCESTDHRYVGPSPAHQHASECYPARGPCFANSRSSGATDPAHVSIYLSSG